MKSAIWGSGKISLRALLILFCIGIHTRVIVTGAIGTKQFTDNLRGNAANVAPSIELSEEPGNIQVTKNTYCHLKGGCLNFELTEYICHEPNAPPVVRKIVT
ncbi:adenylate/guanylate cyclase domain-containing protein [Lusitaniella coriacea]|uniref:adenylate/guanylate cyclase domain-containing protein n=1 Tax=Lusitaniella coriacea TaxID=1983105 RepID=UPI003CEABB76